MKKILYFLLIILFVSSFSVVKAEETLIILDSSLSMNEDFYGKPKYLAAVQEAKKIISSIDNSRKIGLRTIGIKINESILNYVMDPKLMCKATQLDAPIRNNNISYINAALDSLIPLGTTPIEYTLRTAINSDFSYGPHLKHIILITDGAESCDADPCKFIRQVMVGRNDIRIDVLAISVNDEDFNQLKCLSDNTNGVIVNIKNTEDLHSSLQNSLKYPVKADMQASYTNNLQRTNNIKYKNVLLETFD